LKQNGVKHFLDSNNVDVVAISETKLNAKSIGLLMKVRFNGWSYGHNLLETHGGHILLLWKEDKVDVNIIKLLMSPLFVRSLLFIISLHLFMTYILLLVGKLLGELVVFWG
jgi:hypothetical protein